MFGAQGGGPDPTLAGIALIVGAVLGGVGALLTAVFTVKQGRPRRRRGRVPWPKEARDKLAEMTDERDQARRDADEWKRRYDAREDEWLRILRYMADGQEP